MLAWLEVSRQREGAADDAVAGNALLVHDAGAVDGSLRTEDTVIDLDVEQLARGNPRTVNEIVCPACRLFGETEELVPGVSGEAPPSGMAKAGLAVRNSTTSTAAASAMPRTREWVRGVVVLAVTDLMPQPPCARTVVLRVPRRAPSRPRRRAPRPGVRPSSRPGGRHRHPREQSPGRCLSLRTRRHHAPR